MNGRIHFVASVIAWMNGTYLLLVLFGQIQFRVFVAISVIGFLFLIEMTDPITITPPWRQRLLWISLIGLLLTAGVLLYRIVTQFPPGRI